MGKPRPCKWCSDPRKDWSQSTLLNAYCGPACAAKHAQHKRTEARLKAERKQRRDARERLKTRSDWQKEAQAAVNAFVRERDALNSRPCIVHGTDCPHTNTGWDAGHFLAVGSGGGSPLRFNTWNIHRQCRAGNRGAHKWSRYQRGSDAMYEEGLRQRIGDERVDWLKGPHEPKQYRIDDLKRIKRIFSRRARNYRKWRNA